MTINLEMWHYHPTVAGNAVGLALSVLLFVLQAFLGFKYKQWLFCVSWLVALSFNIIGFIIRLGAETFSGSDRNLWIVQYSFFLLSPTLLMVGIYYQMSKLIVIFGRHFTRFGPLFYTRCFIGIDVCSILIQAAGGGLASGGANSVNIGVKLAETGVIIQLAGMIVWVVLLTMFVVRVKKSSSDAYDPAHQSARNRPLFPYFVPALYVCWLFIFGRCIFRIAEMFDGWSGRLATTEGYFLAFDCLFVVIAISALTIVHPGLAFGQERVGVHRKERISGDDEEELQQHHWVKGSNYV